ncbi:hypothetical protein [Elizabethkingia meningoseptica]|uniref:hypothetical protein n=1 Tax=Elizabethkingia meningoseptica TaxID=238 RepID=UPI0023B02D1A|nr:hypothetical protein [Elizabethkingia meningoseptica]MDE5490844.1 hypothetical protein [Elizabethkingia meningoseptica]
MRLFIRILVIIICFILMGFWFATQVPRQDLDQFMQMSGGRGFRIKLPVFVLMGIFLLYFWALMPPKLKDASKNKRLLYAILFFISGFVGLFGLGILILIWFEPKPIYF